MKRFEKTIEDLDSDVKIENGWNKKLLLRESVFRRRKASLENKTHIAATFHGAQLSSLSSDKRVPLVRFSAILAKHQAVNNSATIQIKLVLHSG